MAEETTAGLGEALGLQTSATPYSGSPIFRGLQTGLQYEMKREALKAKEAEAEEKKLKEFSKYVTKPKIPVVGPRLSKRMEETALRTKNEMFNAASVGDKQGADDAYIIGTVEANKIQEIYKNEENILRSQTLLPTEIANAIGSGKDDNTTFEKLPKDWYEHISPVFLPDVGGSPFATISVVRESKPINMDKINDDIIDDVLSDQPLTATGTFVRNYFGVKQELNDKQIRGIAKTLINQNLEYRDNALTRKVKKGIPLRDKYVMSGLPISEAKERALEDLIFADLKERYQAKHSVRPLPKPKDKWSTTANQMFSKVNPQAAIGDVNFVKAVYRSNTGEALSDDAANSVISRAGYNPEYQSVALSEKSEVTLEDEKGNPVKMVVNQLIDVDNFENPELNGVYIVGTSSMIGQGGDVQFKIGNIAFNKIVKLTPNNIGSLASASKIDTKEFVSVINEKTKREFIPLSIIEGTIVQKRGGGKSTSTGGGKGKGKSTTPKDSFPTWKSKNPNGTPSQYKQYLES
jgi:hypothetical protein